MREQKNTSSWVSTTMVALALFAIGAFSSPGYAQVKPGDFITPENATKVKDLVGPGVYFKVERGMSMKIVPTQRVDWPPPYKDGPAPNIFRSRLCRGAANRRAGWEQSSSTSRARP